VQKKDAVATYSRYKQTTTLNSLNGEVLKRYEDNKLIGGTNADAKAFKVEGKS